MVADGLSEGLAEAAEIVKSLQISGGPQRVRTADLRHLIDQIPSDLALCTLVENGCPLTLPILSFASRRSHEHADRDT
jgi:hypothetical protein